MYIVESTDKKTRFSIPLPSLLQASVNCLVQDNFTVKYTRSHKDSMLYLACVTRTLINIYKVCVRNIIYESIYFHILCNSENFQNKSLVGCKKEQLTQTSNMDGVMYFMEFKEFNKSSSKQRVRVNDIFYYYMHKVFFIV